MAVIDFNLWPVVIKPWGPRKNLYKWPYYFSRSKTNIQRTNELALNWATEADRIIEKHGKNIALICMEELDEPSSHKNSTKNETSRKHPHILFKGIQCITNDRNTQRSRFVSYIPLSCRCTVSKSNIPQIAIGHDPQA